MCYDIKASLESQLKRARYRGDLQAIDEILEKLIPLTDLPIYHASGFSHPEILIYTDDSIDFPKVATWGLVPNWIKDEVHLKNLWDHTLIARGETIFEKPSFKEAAMHGRCLIYIDGFYEHHHYNNKTYPFFIQRNDKKPIVLAGLWNEWINQETNGRMNTFSIVTTKGNLLMDKIHNNPKIECSRMPLILPDALAGLWLKPIENDLDKINLQELIKSYPEDLLKAHSVHKLRGKEYLGNVEEISDKVDYKELKNTLVY